MVAHATLESAQEVVTSCDKGAVRPPDSLEFAEDVVAKKKTRSYQQILQTALAPRARPARVKAMSSFTGRARQPRGPHVARGIQAYLIEESLEHAVLQPHSADLRLIARNYDVKVPSDLFFCHQPGGGSKHATGTCS